MDEGRQERLQKLFKSTLLLASDLRTAYLDRECGIDIDLRREIEVLLLGEKSTEVLHTTVAGGARFPDREPEFTGNDRFVVQRRLGSGGFGVVFQVYDRYREAVVALKTLRRTGAGPHRP